MKFIEQPPEWHSYGAERTESWFALFPVTIGAETRWLESVTVVFAWDMGNFYMGESDCWRMLRFA